MWDFVESDNGVAVKTTVGRLQKALAYAPCTAAKKAKPSICAVEYVDHPTYFLEHDGFRNLLSIVRESWSNEQEVRAVAKSAEFLNLPLEIKQEIEFSDPKSGPVIPEFSLEEKQGQIEKVASEARMKYTDVRTSMVEGFYVPISIWLRLTVTC